MNNLGIILVICIFITIYGGLHYYLYSKLKTLLPAHNKSIILILAALAVSIIVIEVMLHNEITLFITPLAWISFFWMGVVVLFFGVSLPIDVFAILARTVQANKLAHRLNTRTRNIAVSLFVIILAIIGTFNAQQINIEQVHIKSAKITQPLRIVQITDLHIGNLSRQSHIQKIVDAINHLKPDIIVSTGDLIDMSTDNSASFITALAGLRSRLGKFAVYGNHETFVGLEKSSRLTKQSGFTLLSNAGVTPGGVINIFGVDDPSVAGRMQPGALHPDEANLDFSNSLFTILLKHQPVIANKANTSFDLQMSGHVHGGQIYPFGFLTRLVYRVPMGLSLISDKKWLYVSRGTGTWGPPMRILSAPEITLFQLDPVELIKK